MSQNKFVIGLLLLFFGCNTKSQKNYEYINHDKWLTDPESINRHQMKGKPREISETVYISLSDTTLNATGKIFHNEIFRFDEEGNLVYRKFSYPANNAQQETFITYDENGKQSREVAKAIENRDNAPGSETIRKSERIGPHRFTTSITIHGRPEFGPSVVSFENNGRIVRIESWRGDSVVSSAEKTYGGDTLLSWRWEQKYPASVTVTSYYYSTKGFLDSMNTKLEGSMSVMDKHAFINNDQGDPVYKAVTYYTIVTETERNVYQYDEKGNWIRRIRYYEKRNSIEGDRPYLGHTLWVREIKY